MLRDATGDASAVWTSRRKLSSPSSRWLPRPTS